MTKANEVNEHLPDVTIAASGTHKDIRWYVTKMKRPAYFNRGVAGTQYNGYAELPDDHPVMLIDNGYAAAGKYLNPHGGITYTQGNVVGFDTAHSGDNEDMWPLEAVKKETINLVEQVLETNTDRDKEVARQAIEIRNSINRKLEEITKLGFTAYDLNIYT